VIRFVILAAALAFLAGCDPGPKTYRVTGTVSWQGNPVADGTINLIAEDGMSTPASAKIADGKFELVTTAGMKKVEVFNRRNKGYDPVMKQDIMTNDIPTEYNGSETKLRFEVKPDAENVLDLKLPQK
jgi:hypothetical protein